jgi:hypothetical protein
MRKVVLLLILVTLASLAGLVWLRVRPSTPGNEVEEKAARLAEIHRLSHLGEAVSEEEESLLRGFLVDGDPEVRREALIVVARIARSKKLSCPSLIIEALLDPDEEVRETAQNHLVFERFGDDAYPLLERALREGDTTARSLVLTPLGDLAANDPRALAALKRATADTSPLVRHNAHAALWRANRDPSVLHFCLETLGQRMEEEAGIRKPTPGAPAELSGATLRVYGCVRLLADAFQERPAETTRSVIGFLGDGSAMVRQAGLAFLAAMARRNSSVRDLLRQPELRDLIRTRCDDEDGCARALANGLVEKLAEESGRRPEFVQPVNGSAAFEEELLFELCTAKAFADPRSRLLKHPVLQTKKWESIPRKGPMSVSPLEHALAEIHHNGGALEKDEAGHVITVDLSHFEWQEPRREVDHGLPLLRNIQTLERLNLRNSSVTDRGMEHLSGLHRLRRIGLGHTGISDAGLKHLKELTHLEILDLGNTQVTDAGLVSLRHCSELRILSLQATQVTDEGLTQLDALAKLEAIDLQLTRVTPKGVERFVKAHPTCTLHMR